MSEPSYLEVEFHRDQQRVAVEVAVWSCGGRATTIASTSPELLVQLVSSYLVDDDLETGLVAEAWEPSYESRAQLHQRTVSCPPGTATHWREHLLRHHLERFVELAGEHGIDELRYEVPQAAEQRFIAA